MRVKNPKVREAGAGQWNQLSGALGFPHGMRLECGVSTGEEAENDAQGVVQDALKGLHYRVYVPA